MFDSDVDSLLEITVADFLVDDNADGGFCDVVDDSGFPVVDFEWHTLLDGTVYFDVDDVSDPDRLLLVLDPYGGRDGGAHLYCRR